ncbi:trypsin-like serine protease [Saccharopolyspora rhizosphaerae]|uniref:Trypsin-like serine protease n=1 Tax=Saccharopolyspora rhizosphaerae TaxID=2492662 RepID=A0A426K5N4_9PSEU|nr:alpha-lytic protease prodomain-containing protein [Saccharopolyspora rhizosphaerae]RRO20717.1 trypsin-like serine protease [Saccharopolyspora rhizosphaerae]
MKPRTAARISGAALAAAGLLTALTTPATLAEPAAPAEPGMIAAMQRDLGLTAEQAEARLAQEAVAARADSAVRESLGGSFGGSYFDADLGKLVVGTTDPAKADEVRAAGAEPRQVGTSEQQLDQIVEVLNGRSEQAPASVTGWYADVRQNTVVVTTQPGTAAEATGFVQDARVAQESVRVVESPAQPRTYADVVGGYAYYTAAGARCSMGFAVQGGFVTAGHCGGQGEQTTQPTGTFAGSSFPGNDYAYVSTGSDDTGYPLVYDYSGGYVAVSGSSEAPLGASICRSGSTTGWHCGAVLAKNQTVQYQQGTVSGLTRTNVCAEPGDSGGSFISGNQAQGMTSGGWGDCRTGGETYFQPVREALSAYGLSLLTQ